MEVRVGPAAVTIHSDGEFAGSELTGDMSSTRGRAISFPILGWCRATG